MSRTRPAKRPPAGTGSSSGFRLPAWVDIAALTFLILLLASWSWRKWPDVFVDYGHELYIPWQLSEGRVLYRDITYFMGPLSQYVNALLFGLLGASFTTLIVANLAITGAITAMIRALFARALGRPAGLVAAASFLLVFAFAHYVRLGNYNYVTPYLHEQTHGAALGIAMLVLLERAARLKGSSWTAAAGTALGLTFLTKAESFVPALAAAVTAGILLAVSRRPPLPQAAKQAGLFLGTALVPVLAATVLLATGMPWVDAARGVAGNWVYIFDRDLILDDPFYGGNLGVADSAAQLRDIAVNGLAWIVFAAVGLGLARFMRGCRRGTCLAAGVLIAAFLVATTTYLTWLRLARPFPLMCLAAVLFFAGRARRGQPADFLLALWSVFALASLGKMLLRTRIEHYGFVLAMPATLLVIVTLLFVVPRVLQERGWNGEAWRAASAGALAVGVGWLLTLSNFFYSAKTLPIGRGGDLMYAFDPRFDVHTGYFAATLETLGRTMPPGATLAVFPDGVLLNYLLRSANPTPYYLITPWEMRAFGGEDAVFARIAPVAPDYFVVTKLDMHEYGVPFFGARADYGARTRLWLEQNYDVVAEVGEDRRTQKPWLEIYRRRAGHEVAQRLPDPNPGS